jgi:hypothetical protein
LSLLATACVERVFVSPVLDPPRVRCSARAQLEPQSRAAIGLTDKAGQAVVDDARDGCSASGIRSLTELPERGRHNPAKVTEKWRGTESSPFFPGMR